MSHALVTVFVPVGKSPQDMMAPFDENLEVEPHKAPCHCTYRGLYADASPAKPGCQACHGLGITISTDNPRAKWDYWTQLGINEYIDSRYSRKIEPGEITFALLLPDEGWIDRIDARLYGINHRESEAQEWEERFTTAYERYSKIDDITVVICDYHS